MKTELLIAERQVADQALVESEQRYRRLLAATTDYIYSVEFRQDQTFTKYGPGCEAVTGYSPGEFACDNYLWYRIIHHEDRPAVIAQVDRIMRGEVPDPLEHRVVHKDGSIRWIKNTPIPHRDSEQHLIGYDGLISDITHRKRAEQFLTCQYAVTRDLSESRTLEEAMPKVLRDVCQILSWDSAAYWTADDTSKGLRMLTFWRRRPPRIPNGTNGGNPALTAPTPGMVVQSVWNTGEARCVLDSGLPQNQNSNNFAPGDQERCCVVPVLLGGKSVGVLELRGGETEKTDPLVMELLSGAAGQIGLFIEQDIAELALRQSQERLALVIEGSTDGIWDWDIATGYAYFSPRWKEMLGYADNEVANTSQAWVELLHPEDRQHVLEHLRTYLNGQTSAYELEFRMRHKDGGYRWILARGAALRDATGKPLRMAGSHVDLTERKIAAERLEQAYATLAKREITLKRIVRHLKNSHRQLRDAQRHLIEAARLESVGTLAAGVAHEVKNPLQTILMGLDFVCQKAPPEDRDLAEVLNDMRDAVRRASTIIRELLMLSSNSEFHTKPEDLNTILERALRLLNTNLVAAGIEVVLNLEPNLPAVTVDSTKIQQVFINLMLNAVQAMPQRGTLTLTTRSFKLGPSQFHQPYSTFKVGDALVIAEVRDTGHGIPKNVEPRLFDPFFTTKPVGVGTGLGLSVAKKIVNLHQGEIHIRNHPDGGAVADVTLKI